jgi:hypothetical protein
MTSPTSSVGASTSTFTYGSSRTGLACANALLNAIEPATLNAASEESTEWKAPS